MALPVGLEPTTNRLTADCSTTELRKHVVCERGDSVFKVLCCPTENGFLKTLDSTFAFKWRKRCCSHTTTKRSFSADLQGSLEKSKSNILPWCQRTDSNRHGVAPSRFSSHSMSPWPHFYVVGWTMSSPYLMT